MANGLARPGRARPEGGQAGTARRATRAMPRRASCLTNSPGTPCWAVFRAGRAREAQPIPRATLARGPQREGRGEQEVAAARALAARPRGRSGYRCARPGGGVVRGGMKEADAACGRETGDGDRALEFGRGRRTREGDGGHARGRHRRARGRGEREGSASYRAASLRGEKGRSRGGERGECVTECGAASAGTGRRLRGRGETVRGGS
jgi:hypothetical protein